MRSRRLLCRDLCGRASIAAYYCERPDGLLQVLYPLSTKVLEGHRQDLAHLIVRRTGNAYCPRFCECLQPSRNVHAVAKQVARPDHHVADVNTDPKVDTAVLRKTG